MTSIVLLVVLTPVLWGRVVQGKERKRLVVPGAGAGDAEHVISIQEGGSGLKTLGNEELLAEDAGEAEGLWKEKDSSLRLIVGKDAAVETSRYREG